MFPRPQQNRTKPLVRDVMSHLLNRAPSLDPMGEEHLLSKGFVQRGPIRSRGN
jgi:hypothetical protein